MLCTTDTDVAFVTITHMFSLCQAFSWDPVKICKTGERQNETCETVTVLYGHRITRI